MYNMTERNEVNRRRSALVLAIGLHLGLAALIFLLSTENPKNSGPVSTPVKIEKNQSIPHPKAVKLP